MGYAEPKQTFPGDIICRTYAFAEELARAVQSRARRAGLGGVDALGAAMPAKMRTALETRTVA